MSTNVVDEPQPAICLSVCYPLSLWFFSWTPELAPESPACWHFADVVDTQGGELLFRATEPVAAMA